MANINLAFGTLRNALLTTAATLAIGFFFLQFIFWVLAPSGAPFAFAMQIMEDGPFEAGGNFLVKVEGHKTRTDCEGHYNLWLENADNQSQIFIRQSADVLGEGVFSFRRDIHIPEHTPAGHYYFIAKNYYFCPEDNFIVINKLDPDVLLEVAY